jgi:hypothetical protein
MKKIGIVFISLIILVAGYIVTQDVGDFESKPGGAGEIWWTQVPVIEEVYTNINNK